jgi:hypothetical protein
MKRLMTLPALFLTLTAGQCGSGDHVSSVGERVVYQTVYKAVRQPCPAKEPTPPGKLARPLPTDLGALVDVLTAKLAEYTGSGKYVARVHDFAAVCTKPVPPGDVPVTP